VTLLEALLNDNTDFVRQGACIAMALVLLQQPESVVEPFRKRVGDDGGLLLLLLQQQLQTG
jgi:hypothetical protein